jgi:lysophospholipase
MEKYTETIRELNQRDFRVCSFDWRGQGYSSRLLTDRYKGHIESFNTYLEDMALIVRKVLKPRTQPPFVLLAHSMGGHLALRYMNDHPLFFKSVVLTAPMIDVSMAPFLKRSLHRLAGFVVNHGAGHHYAIGSGKDARRAQAFKGNRLTSDRRRFYRTQQMVTKQPGLAVGGVTYAWLNAAFDSISTLQQHVACGSMNVPVLMLSAGEDKIVSNRAQQSLCKQLPDCRYQAIPGARHEILMEADQYRLLFWKAFDAIKLDV